MDVSGTSESVTVAEALTWARVLLFVRTHGVAGLALVFAMYAMGVFDRAQTYGCGI